MVASVSVQNDHLPMINSGDAAADNARWCDAVGRTHGRTGRFGAMAWTCARRTPPFYPDAVTLDPAATRDDVLPFVEPGPGCSVKDSFAALDLAADGFDVLFEATWVGGSVTGPSSWTPVGPGGFDGWARMVDVGDVLTPALLAEPGVTLLECRRDGELRGVAVLTDGAASVGVSNLVTVDDPVRTWREIAAYVGRPVVGYERGPALDAALAAGLAALGPLRVWMAGERVDA
jgi:hypothetical protein